MTRGWLGCGWQFRRRLIHCGELALEIGQKRRGQLLESLQEIFDVQFDDRIGQCAAGLVGLGRISQCMLKRLAMFISRPSSTSGSLAAWAYRPLPTSFK